MTRFYKALITRGWTLLRRRTCLYSLAEGITSEAACMARMFVSVPRVGDSCSICLEEVLIEDFIGTGLQAEAYDLLGCPEVLGIDFIGLEPRVETYDLLIRPEVAAPASLQVTNLALCVNPDGSIWITLPRCNHRFHARCIRQWSHIICPNCRSRY